MLRLAAAPQGQQDLGRGWGKRGGQQGFCLGGGLSPRPLGLCVLLSVACGAGHEVPWHLCAPGSSRLRWLPGFGAPFPVAAGAGKGSHSC